MSWQMLQGVMEQQKDVRNYAGNKKTNKRRNPSELVCFICGYSIFEEIPRDRCGNTFLLCHG